MINSFYVEDMTSLRYAIPFIKLTKKLLNLDISLVYNSTFFTKKYNDINNDINKKRFLEIVTENNIHLIDSSKKSINSEIVICVENVNKIFYKKLFSVQHGFDYVNLSKTNKLATYLVTEKYFSDELTKSGIKSLIQPFPISLWDCYYGLDKFDFFIDKKTCLLFYIENDVYKNIYFDVQNHIKSLGFNTIIKQRKKHIPIPEAFDNKFYDQLWYPSESILLPVISDIIVGFETTAYIDLVHLKRNFYDFSLNSFVKNIYKPNNKNFIHLSHDNEKSVEMFKSIELPSLSRKEKLGYQIDYKKIKIFLENIFS